MKLTGSFRGIDIGTKMNERKSHGISIAMSDGKKTETFCLGTARYGETLPVTNETLFQAGSVSKPTFALTLLRYVDRGVIDLDADISRVIPEFTKEPLTFSALLSHTAGMNVHGFEGYPVEKACLSLEEVLQGKGNSPKVERTMPYGEQYSYSGGGTTMAELTFTRMIGKDLRTAAEEEVFRPLGMHSSGYYQPLDEDLIPKAAFGGRLGLYHPGHGFRYHPETAAAGLWTTPFDLVQMGIAVSESCRKDGFLKKETAERMITPVHGSYGLCMFRYRENLSGHGGFNHGYQTYWVFIPGTSICVAVCENRNFGCLNEVGDSLILPFLE